MTTGKENHYENEVELIDFLKVIWKWKIYLFLGTILCGAISGFINYTKWKNEPVKYKTQIVIKPGVMSIDKKGNEVFTDSLESIASMIDQEVSEKLLKKGTNVNTTIDENNNIVNATCVSSRSEDCVKQLNDLITTLNRKYAQKREEVMNTYDDQIKAKKHAYTKLEIDESDLKKRYESFLERNKLDLIHLNADIESNKNQLDRIDKHLNVLKTESDFMRSKIDETIAQNKLLNHNDPLQTILHMNTLQQKIDSENRIKENIFQKLSEKNRIMIELKKNMSSITPIQNEIRDLEKNGMSSIPHIYKDFIDIQWNKEELNRAIQSILQEKDGLQSLLIIEPPSSKMFENKNRTRSIVTLSSVVGFFTTLFMVFMIEYIRKHRTSV